jgi:hypothetical protein
VSTSKLPARPSLESLRKQAKKLARDIVGGNTDAIDRARAQMPRAELPLSRRDAQFVLAREYGFPGWKDLVKEVEQRLGGGLEWAVSEARRIIHQNDTEALRQLLTEYPALLSWKADENNGGLLGIATGSYGDSGDTSAEEHFTRAACAELMIDMGAVVMPPVCEELLQSHARGLLQLFRRKGLLPPTLKFLAALGDIDAVRAGLPEGGNSLAVVTEAFSVACGFKHDGIASLLLDRAIALDPDLGPHIDTSFGRLASSSTSSTTALSTRPRPGCGRRLSWNRPDGRSVPTAGMRLRLRRQEGTATWRRSFTSCTASRGCSATPSFRFKLGSSSGRR